MSLTYQNISKNNLTRYLTAWIILIIAIYIALTVWQTTNLNNTNHFTTEIVHIGPINLLEIQKSQLAGGGFKTNFQFLLLGTLIYLGVFSLLAYGQIVYSTRYAKDQSKKTPAKKSD